jgi:hypothetical protein
LAVSVQVLSASCVTVIELAVSELLMVTVLAPSSTTTSAATEVSEARALVVPVIVAAPAFVATTACA